MTKKEIIITSVTIIIMAVLIGLIVWFAKTHKKPEQIPTTQLGNMVVDLNATDEERQNEQSLSSRNVYFAGIEDATVNKEDVVCLENPKQNLDFLMKFEVYDNNTNEMLFETELIPSGKRVYWTPGETVEAGEYSIAFVELPFAPSGDGQYTPLTQGRNVIKLTVTE